MKYYIIYDTGDSFPILEHQGDWTYTYFAECETKAAAEKLIAALNGRLMQPEKK